MEAIQEIEEGFTTMTSSRRDRTSGANKVDAPKVTSRDSQAHGLAALQALRAVLERCRKAGIKLSFPGEGGERRFRGWLVSDFLAAVLGWPPSHTVVGERFDILLTDQDDNPVATIETKTPYHKASAKERSDFEDRLSGFGTLRTAYFTNGFEWERLDLISPQGEMVIQERSPLSLQSATPEEAEAFFAPLEAGRHFQNAVRSGRHAVRRENPHILAALAGDLDQAIGDLTVVFQALFDGLREGRGGAHSRDITKNLFNIWCDKSLVVSPRQAGERLAKALTETAFMTARELTRALVDLGFGKDEVAAASEILGSLPRTKKTNPNEIAEALWPAYKRTVQKLCAQTAHVVLARTLIYRIGEDQSMFPHLLSGDALRKVLSTKPPSIVMDFPLPAGDLLSKVRRGMEDFLPSIYKLGEFDWWLVPAEKRAGLRPAETQWLRDRDRDAELAYHRLLRMLDSYSFGRVDVDVWRNVYQDYLPPDERQRLGGFYTPEELVSLVLDLSEYHPASEGLCTLAFIDPACGSGAFVSGALSRLLTHLSLDLPCHSADRARNIPEWKRAEATLRVVERNMHAVDLHPFAAFLTTMNALFLLMPLYVKARSKNPSFSLDLQVFSADSLEKHDAEILTPDLFARLNSRVQLSEDSFNRYRAMLEKRFDRVFGNPPWGGVLKGPLAPVYDTAQKERLAREFPETAHGKYDIYALFVERSLQILKPGGRFGLITQGSFIDKDWAAGLRALLSSKAKLQAIVDLNPFGQLFFHAMNTPCITVADAVPPNESDYCIAVLSAKPDDFAGMSDVERRQRVVAVIEEVVATVRKRKTAAAGFAKAVRVPITRLKETAQDRWNLASSKEEPALQKGWLTVADVLESFQGVTVGGEGCLDIVLIPSESVRNHKLEGALVHEVVKGRDIARWSSEPETSRLLYPYTVSQGSPRPAFALDLATIMDAELREDCRRAGLTDSLDFERHIDEHERAIGRRGVKSESAAEILRHRIGLGIIPFPKVAAYLVRHYDQLESRVFEQRNIREWGKQWYEYHRPRDPEAMLADAKIITPRLTTVVRFAVDRRGVIPQDSCICMVPTPRTRQGYDALKDQLEQVIGKQISTLTVLEYCLAFLNSEYAQQRLVTGHRPTPKGFYAVTGKYLEEIPIPPPKAKKAVELLSLVTTILNAPESKDADKRAARLQALTADLMAAE